MGESFKGLEFIKQAAVNASVTGDIKVTVGTVSDEPSSYAPGQFYVDRGGFEHELIRLFDAYAPERDNGWREYGVDFENDVFWLHIDYEDGWENCSCAVKTLEADWLATHDHEKVCFQPYLAAKVTSVKDHYPVPDDRCLWLKPGPASIARMAQLINPNALGPTAEELETERLQNLESDRIQDEWRRAYDAQKTAVGELVMREAAAHGITRGQSVELERENAYWMWEYLCTCGFQERKESAQREFSDQHTKPCEAWWADQPNFFYKPTGYGIDWYKYPCRSAHGNQEMTVKQFREIIDACIASVERPNGNAE